MSDEAPSGYAVGRVMSAWNTARQALLDEDPELVHDEGVLTEMLGDAGGDVDEILTRACRAAVHAKSMSEQADVRSKEIKARSDRYDRRYETMRLVVLAILTATERKKHELPDLLASIRAGTQTVRITDEKKIPARFFRTIPASKAVDKALLKTALADDGEVIDGAELSNGTPSIQLRSR